MICDELLDYYKKLISVTKDNAYIALRGGITLSKLRFFNVFKLALTDNKSSPLSVTGIKINYDKLYDAAPLGLVMSSTESTLFLLALDY
jgi:hypothetical protein